MPEPRTCVMISSTARDLPEHRKEVMDACLRQGMFPVMMEHLPASDDEAISASLKMVDEADIYAGVFAHRYGYVPKGHAISVTEMEYNRAVERKIPRCIFVMDKEHPLKIDDVEMGEGAVKLDAFKKPPPSVGGCQSVGAGRGVPGRPVPVSLPLTIPSRTGGSARFHPCGGSSVRRCRLSCVGGRGGRLATCSTLTFSSRS
jgi:hypothetical protein